MIDSIPLIGEWSPLAIGAALLSLSGLVFVLARVIGALSGNILIGDLIKATRAVSFTGMTIGGTAVSISLASLIMGLFETSFWWLFLIIPLLVMLFLSFVTIAADDYSFSGNETAREAFTGGAIRTLIMTISLLVIATVAALVVIAALSFVSLFIPLTFADSGIGLTVTLSVMAAIVLLSLPLLILATE